MNFEIIFSPKVRDEMHEMKQDHGMERYLKDIHKALEYLAHDPKHPGLHTHKNADLEGANGEEVFEAYAENNSPGAYRIFWHYGPGRAVITVIDIIRHPK